MGFPITRTIESHIPTTKQAYTNIIDTLNHQCLSEGSIHAQKHDSHEDKFWAEQVNILLEYLYDHYGKHQLPEIYLNALDNIDQKKTPMAHQSINLFLGAQKGLKYELEKI